MIFCSITRKEIVKTDCVGKGKLGTPEGQKGMLDSQRGLTEDVALRYR